MSSVRNRLAKVTKLAITLAVAATAVAAVWYLYQYYTYAPQTRDGRIRADVVALAADVSGRVDEVLVKDNQDVHKGDVLFTIDRARLRNALAQAQAAVNLAKSTLSAAERENNRYKRLANADSVSEQQRDTRASAAEQAQASYEKALADREAAQINLDRAEVRAPVNGTVTNFSLRPGAFATAGQPVMALVDSDSFYVAGYFEETKLPHIRKGAKVTIRIMGIDQPLLGRVESWSAAIDDRERTTSAGSLLANVNPTFSWVRLAQRVPVRIAFDNPPSHLELIAGRTVTVAVE